jgi:hypothetical protein
MGWRKGRLLLLKEIGLFLKTILCFDFRSYNGIAACVMLTYVTTTTSYKSTNISQKCGFCESQNWKMSLFYFSFFLWNSLLNIELVSERYFCLITNGLSLFLFLSLSLSLFLSPHDFLSSCLSPWSDPTLVFKNAKAKKQFFFVLQIDDTYTGCQFHLTANILYFNYFLGYLFYGKCHGLSYIAMFLKIEVSGFLLACFVWSSHSPSNQVTWKRGGGIEGRGK